MATAKRDLLLETAERLFYAEGFHATGIDRIVQAAGVVRMTLYNHFPSKQALVAAVLARRHARFMAAVDTAVENASAGQATWALVDAHGDWLRTVGQHGCILMKALGEFTEHAPEIREQAVAAKQDLHRRLRDALARDGYLDNGDADDGDADDGAPEDGDLTTRLFLVLEGANAGVPVFGAEATIRHARASIHALLSAASTQDQTEVR
ncbi:TetR/AcrR family transcriptional regulator [Rhodovibrio salinarum]|uniref:TetR/AcrR family transcriptional regulator n=1 Tax=Rhodovibrio salinarum TaxID=1087 RepID=A0A934V044_9PROT|nr:TetR/AcrR family transcriptional regulator [Rhodovibrio salinarum]MBK1697064.1 TetR/AcrR family transcriptional regulator [Rhodovibrio salinarum]